jgi:hypothetical protein
VQQVTRAGCSTGAASTLEARLCCHLQGKRWVEKLLGGEYDCLTLEERLEAALDLMHLALDMPSTRAALDRRIDDVERAKKAIRDEAKVERKARQAAMAKRAKLDADRVAAQVAKLRDEMAAQGACLWCCDPSSETQHVPAVQANACLVLSVCHAACRCSSLACRRGR